jgi:hypothetical protein
MMQRVAAVAALGVLLAGCAAGPTTAGVSASSSASAELTARAELIGYVCEYMKDPAATVGGLGRDLVNRGKYPDHDTAVYSARAAISEGCPQYDGR